MVSSPTGAFSFQRSGCASVDTGGKNKGRSRASSSIHSLTETSWQPYALALGRCLTPTSSIRALKKEACQGSAGRPCPDRHVRPDQLQSWPVVRRQNRPARKSAKASSICSWVFITKGPPNTTGSRKGLPANSRRRIAPPLALIVTTEGASSLRVSQANSPEATGRSCLPTIAEPSRMRRKAFAPA
jgi:hypothetical protein